MTEIKCHLTLDNCCEDRADCFDSEVSVLQCVAVCVSVFWVLRSVTECFTVSVLQCVPVWVSVLQCVPVCVSVFWVFQSVTECFTPPCEQTTQRFSKVTSTVIKSIRFSSELTFRSVTKRSTQSCKWRARRAINVRTRVNLHLPSAQ